MNKYSTISIKLHFLISINKSFSLIELSFHIVIIIDHNLIVHQILSVFCLRQILRESAGRVRRNILERLKIQGIQLKDRMPL